MTENCSIYCREPCSPSVEEFLKDLFPNKFLSEINGSITIKEEEGSLRISTMKFKHAGDDFSQLVGSTYLHFDLIKTEVHSAKSKLLDHIENSNCILGIVADPTFDSYDRFNHAVFAIAKRYNGVVFNGYEVLDQNGKLVLDNDGKSEYDGCPDQ